MDIEESIITELRAADLLCTQTTQDSLHVGDVVGGAPMQGLEWPANPAFFSRRLRGQAKKGKSGDAFHPRRRSKKVYLLLSIFLCLFLGVSAFGVAAYRGTSDVALAKAGIQHLQKAEVWLAALQKNPLDSQAVQQAQHEFAAALPAFVQLDNDLKLLPGTSTAIPIYGAQLRAALHLVPVAIELSQAGIAGCDILNMLITRLHNPLNIQQEHGLTLADFSIIGQDVQRIKSAFNLAIAEIKQVRASDVQFDQHLSKMFALFQKEIPALQVGLDIVERLLPVLPTVLGIATPTNYLIEVLDSTELRPAGGFIGNYGIATLSGGRLVAAHITDVDLLDRPFEAAGNKIAYPSAYSWFDLAQNSWSLRDSNLDANFPTSAQYGEQNYTREGGKVPLQGVIAITPVLMEHALAITGPIEVPEYHETITAQNLIARIHFHQLGGKAAHEGSDLIPSPDGHSSQRKRFTELLAEHFLAHVHQLPASALAQFVQLMIHSVHAKDLQVYLNPSGAEQVLQRFHVDAGIQAPTGDSIFVVDANIGSNKANSFITATLNDQVTVDGEGNAMHHTTINYAWLGKGTNYGSPVYRDYAQVYVPPGSTLQAQKGWQLRGTSTVFGRQVWAGLFTLTNGQTHTITLLWTERAAAKKDANGWHYQYLIQRQAGTQWKLELHVTLPSCAVITNRSGGVVSNDRQSVTLSKSLEEDMNVDIDYHC